MLLIKFNTKEELKINNMNEVIELLKYCNPLMIKHYQRQIKNYTLIGSGKDIEVKRNVK